MTPEHLKTAAKVVGAGVTLGLASKGIKRLVRRRKIANVRRQNLAYAREVLAKRKSEGSSSREEPSEE